MSKIKLIIVPAWLNLIMKELGVTNEDLADYEKLSGIVSPRDLLIYKIANFNGDEILAKLLDVDVQTAHKAFAEFEGALPVPGLEERAACANMSLDTLIYGATSARDAEHRLLAEVVLTDTEVLTIRLVPFNRASDELRDCVDSVATKVTKVMHGRVGLEQLAGLGIFKRYVEEVQINPVFY